MYSRFATAVFFGLYALSYFTGGHQVFAVLMALAAAVIAIALIAGK